MQPLVIAQISVEPFKCYLQQPFMLAGEKLSFRAGFYVTLTSTTGLTAKGEASPLPHFSTETLKRTQHDLHEIISFLTRKEVPLAFEEAIDFMRKEPHFFNLCPSARFAVESAMLELCALHQQKTLADFIGAINPKPLSAGLLQGPREQMILDAKDMVAQGVKVFKLKVGNRNIALDVQNVDDVRRIIPLEGLIRLDANRSWTLKEALLFAELVGLDRIDFIEEPLDDPSKISEFYHKTGMSVGLDETIPVLRCGVNAPGRCSPTLAHQEGVKVFVLKPMMLGCVPTLEWILEAKVLSKKVIISSAYETDVGMKVLYALAGLSGQAAGLGTVRWLKKK